MENSRKNTLRKKYLSELVKHGPISWSLIRMTELEVLSDVKFKKPILELACGDGTFSKILFKKKDSVDIGIDILEKEIKEAKKQNVYKSVEVADARNLPFKANTFSTVFSNGSLEHIANVEKVLSEVSRVLKPNGTLVITVPSSNFSKNLSVSTLFYSFGLKSPAKFYANVVNAAFAHKNLWTANIWSKKLSRSNMTLVSHKEYNSQFIVWLHEIFFLTAIPSIIFKKITGSFFVFKNFRKISSPFLIKLLFPLVVIDTDKRPCSLLIIARKNAKS